MTKICTGEVPLPVHCPCTDAGPGRSKTLHLGLVEVLLNKESLVIVCHLLSTGARVEDHPVAYRTGHKLRVGGRRGGGGGYNMGKSWARN